MDVSLFRSRFFRWGATPAFLFLLFSSGGCGNRFDVNSEHGRQASIDEAKYHLSRGECSLAAAAINPLYASSYVNDEIRIIKAGTYACASGFNLLTMVANLASNTNIFQGLALSLSNRSGDGASGNFYSATDVMTQSGGAMSASQRSAKENTFMVFLQMGTVASIIRNYGNASSTGVQQTAFAYNPGALSNVDACALAAAVSFIEDSFYGSDLNDATTRSSITQISNLCVTYTGSTCSVINRDRTVCNGANAQSVTAKSVVTGVDATW